MMDLIHVSKSVSENPLKGVRLDANTASGYHQPQERDSYNNVGATQTIVSIRSGSN